MLFVLSPFLDVSEEKFDVKSCLPLDSVALEKNVVCVETQPLPFLADLSKPALSMFPPQKKGK